MMSKDKIVQIVVAIAFSLSVVGYILGEGFAPWPYMIVKQNVANAGRWDLITVSGLAFIVVSIAYSALVYLLMTIMTRYKPTATFLNRTVVPVLLVLLAITWIQLGARENKALQSAVLAETVAVVLIGHGRRFEAKAINTILLIHFALWFWLYFVNVASVFTLAIPAACFTAVFSWRWASSHSFLVAGNNQN